MKIPLSILLVTICGVVLVQAAPPTDQSINEMLRVVQVEKMLNQMLTQMDAGMKSGVEQALQQSLHGQELTPAQKAAVDNFRQKVSATMKEELSFAKMKDLYVQVYRETFTQEEVNSIIAFYGSAAGKAMVEKIPVAMQKAGTLMQARIGPMTQKIQAMQEEFLKEMSKTK
jgi:uncharacterized protein